MLKRPQDVRPAVYDVPSFPAIALWFLGRLDSKARELLTGIEFTNPTPEFALGVEYVVLNLREDLRVLLRDELGIQVEQWKEVPHDVD